MPFNVLDSLNQASANGLALGQTMANNAYRMQELKSRQAMQRLQEQQMAQNMALQLDLYHRKIEQEAEVKKAWATFNALSTPTVSPNGLPTGTVGADGSSEGVGGLGMGGANGLSSVPFERPPEWSINPNAPRPWDNQFTNPDVRSRLKDENGNYIKAGPDIGPPTKYDQMIGTLTDAAQASDELAKDPHMAAEVMRRLESNHARNPLQTTTRGQALLRAFGPTVKTAADAERLIAEAGQLDYRDAQRARLGQPTPRAPSLVAVDEARQQLLKEQQNLAKTRANAAAQGQGYAPTDTQKNLKALAEAVKAADEDAIKALRKQLKLDELSPTEMTKFRSELRSLENDIGLMGNEAEKEKRREAIYRKYDRSGVSAVTPPEPAEEETIIVIDPQGRKGRIPRRNLEKALQRGYKEYEG